MLEQSPRIYSKGFESSHSNTSNQEMGEHLRWVRVLPSLFPFHQPHQRTDLQIDGSRQGSWLSCHEFEPSTTKAPPCRSRCTLNQSRPQISSRWCGGVARRGVPAQVAIERCYAERKRMPSEVEVALPLVSKTVKYPF
ncbi:uncharacterized protein TNCV_1048221 [Trichonephila clavipes]|nr:uncharacterized protein TNCV_1048221 [Trichonephila clavipes]